MGKASRTKKERLDGQAHSGVAQARALTMGRGKVLVKSFSPRSAAEMIAPTPLKTAEEATMEYRLTPPEGKKLAVGLGVLTYSVSLGSPLWVAIENDNLPLVQILAARIVESGINIFSVTVAMLDGQGGISEGNILGLACGLKAVETTVWLYKQIPAFMPVESFDLSTRGFLSFIEDQSEDTRLAEIPRRCLEWNFTLFHEARIKSGAPIKRLGAGPVAAALYMDIGLRLQAAHEQKLLDAETPSGCLPQRAAGLSARL